MAITGGIPFKRRFDIETNTLADTLICLQSLCNHLSYGLCWQCWTGQLFRQIIAQRRIYTDEIAIQELLPCNVGVRTCTAIEEVEIWPGWDEFSENKKQRRARDRFNNNLIPAQQAQHSAGNAGGGDPSPAPVPSLEDLEMMLPNEAVVCEGDPGEPDVPPLADLVMDGMIDIAEAQGLRVDVSEDAQCDGLPLVVGLEASEWLHGDGGDIGAGVWGPAGEPAQGHGDVASHNFGWHSLNERLSHDEFVVPGLPAVFKYDRRLHRLAAHYRWSDGPEGLVRIGRVLIGSASSSDRRKWQGRPIGFMLAWMHAPGSGCGIDDVHSHRQLAEFEMRFHPALAYQRRVDLRKWAAQQPELIPLFQLCVEEGGLPSPREEPLGISY